MFKEAGGKFEYQIADEMLVNDSHVIAAIAVIFDRLIEMADEAFGSAVKQFRAELFHIPEVSALIRNDEVRETLISETE